MQKTTYIFFIPFMFVVGILFFAYQREYLIIKLPEIKIIKQIPTITPSISKKKINLTYWHNNKWNSEKLELIWSINNSENLQRITAAWLSLLDEEKIIDKKISIQTAILSSNLQDAYLSFDRSPFNDEQSTFDKLMFIESLLKTIKEADICIQKIQFLVHHQELSDPHLSFANPWTLQGFVQNS